MFLGYFKSNCKKYDHHMTAINYFKLISEARANKAFLIHVIKIAS
jgi:hypothetical protein